MMPYAKTSAWWNGSKGAVRQAHLTHQGRRRQPPEDPLPAEEAVLLLPLPTLPHTFSLYSSPRRTSGAIQYGEPTTARGSLSPPSLGTTTRRRGSHAQEEDPPTAQPRATTSSSQDSPVGGNLLSQAKVTHHSRVAIIFTPDKAVLGGEKGQHTIRAFPAIPSEGSAAWGRRRPSAQAPTLEVRSRWKRPLLCR